MFWSSCILKKNDFDRRRTGEQLETSRLQKGKGRNLGIRNFSNYNVEKV